MNSDQAKEILLLCRPHAGDGQDSQVREALELARRDSELARWLELHQARQSALREKFRQIPVPEGLKEQIISEHAASLRRAPRFRQWAVIAAPLVILFLMLAAGLVIHRRPADDTLAIFQQQMAGFALRGYAMDLLTNDPARIRAYLEQRHSPADYALTGPLKQAAQSGCAVESWQDTRVSMICFRTGRPLPPGSESDLWLFVVDQKTVKNARLDPVPRIAPVNQLITATWVQDGRLYFLVTEGAEPDIKRFL